MRPARSRRRANSAGVGVAGAPLGHDGLRLRRRGAEPLPRRLLEEQLVVDELVDGLPAVLPVGVGVADGLGVAPLLREVLDEEAVHPLVRDGAVHPDRVAGVLGERRVRARRRRRGARERWRGAGRHSSGLHPPSGENAPDARSTVDDPAAERPDAPVRAVGDRVEEADREVVEPLQRGHEPLPGQVPAGAAQPLHEDVEGHHGRDLRGPVPVGDAGLGPQPGERRRRLRASRRRASPGRRAAPAPGTTGVPGPPRARRGSPRRAARAPGGRVAPPGRRPRAPASLPRKTTAFTPFAESWPGERRVGQRARPGDDRVRRPRPFRAGPGPPRRRRRTRGSPGWRMAISGGRDPEVAGGVGGEQARLLPQAALQVEHPGIHRLGLPGEEREGSHERRSSPPPRARPPRPRPRGRSPRAGRRPDPSRRRRVAAARPSPESESNPATTSSIFLPFTPPPRFERVGARLRATFRMPRAHVGEPPAVGQHHAHAQRCRRRCRGRGPGRPPSGRRAGPARSPSEMA